MGAGQYFATLPAKEFVAACHTRIDDFYKWSSDTGRTVLIRKGHALANGLSVNGTGASAFALTRGGEQGEILHSRENHFRSIGNNLLTITTSQRPSIQCSAANSDYKSLAQALLANGLVEYYLTERKLEAKLKKATKLSIFQTEGFVLLEWDAQDGEPYLQDEEAGTTIKTGDLRANVLGPLDVIRDVSAPSFEELDWVITREWVNKHELAARYPELSERIVPLEAQVDRDRRIDFSTSRQRDYGSSLIPLYKLFHKKTAAVPEGRMAHFLDGDLALYDGPLPYPDLPVFRVVPDEVEGTPFGTSALLDLMGPQETIDALDTTITTNQLGRGVGNLVTDDNGDVSVEQLSTSMNLIKKRPGSVLEPLEFPATPPELFQYKEAKVSAMEVLSGVNSVVRGDPSENVGADASGAKLALIQAQAVQSNSGLQASYANLMRDVALGIIHRFRDFGGDVPRLARLAGKNNQYMVKEFTSSDLSDIDRVTVDIGSPLMRTVSGKMAIADKLIELGVVKTAEQYLMLVKAGTYEPMVEGEQSRQMRISSENERLMDGRPVRATIADPHWLEVRQHLSVLDNPALREPGPENEAIQQAVLGHVQEHIELFRSMPPDMALLAGGPEGLEMWQAIQAALAPPPPPVTSGTPPPAPGEASQTPPPASGAEDVANPEASQEALPGLPAMPVNPATGEQAEPPPGALVQ